MGVTEGVYPDGCSGPMVYTPTHINSEIFERLRSSGDTPSVSLSLDSSLREGAGSGCWGAFHSTGYLRNRKVSGDFHRPYGGRVPFIVPLGNRGGAGDFHRPYGGRVPFIAPPGDSNVAGDFHRPYEGSDFFTFHRSSEYSLKLGVNLFQEICNIVSVQIKGYFGILVGQIIACAGQEVGDVEGGFCFRGLKDDGGNAAGFQHQ